MRPRHEQHDRCLRLEADHGHVRLEAGRDGITVATGAEQDCVDVAVTEVRHRIPHLGRPGDDLETAAGGGERLPEVRLAVERARDDDPEGLMSVACGEHGHLLPPASTVANVSAERLLSFGFLTGRSCSVQSPLFIT